METPPEGGSQRPELLAGSPMGSLSWSSGPLGPHLRAVSALPALRVLAAPWEKPIPSGNLAWKRTTADFFLPSLKVSCGEVRRDVWM